MSQAHKDTVLAFYEAIDTRKPDRISAVCTPAATFQFGGAPAISLAQFVGMTTGGPATGMRHVVREMVVEGDKLACHVDVVGSANGVESVTKALTLYTFEGGKIAHELVILDRGLPS